MRLCSISKNAVLVMDEFAEPYGITMSITSKSPWHELDMRLWTEALKLDSPFLTSDTPDDDTLFASEAIALWGGG